MVSGDGGLTGKASQKEQWTRETIAEKINWCYNNLGPVAMVIDGLSLEEVDTGI